MPKKENYKRAGLNEIPDQGKEGSCTAYAMVNIINGFKEPKYKKEWLKREAINGSDYFKLVNSKYPPDLQGALTPTMALYYARDNWFISIFQAFYGGLTADKFKKLLKAWFLFMVTLHNCDRDITKKTYIATKRKEPGGLTHSVALVDYDDDKKLFKIVNSRGPERGDGGYFYIKYDELDLFIDQIYAIYDSDDTNNFDRLLYKAKVLGVVNTLSEQRKRGTTEEQKALNFANTMLRKVVLGQDHQYNMSKKDLIAFINKYFN